MVAHIWATNFIYYINKRFKGMVIFMKNEKELNYYVPTDSINGDTEYVLVNFDEFVSKKNKED